MENLKLSITKQISKNPSAEAEIKDRLGGKFFDSALRVSDTTLLELLEEGEVDIAVLRNVVAYEACQSAKPLLTKTGIDSGMKLIWNSAFGDSVWQNGLREPRLCTPFPKSMRADFELANKAKKNPAPTPLIYKIEEGLSKTELDKIREDMSCRDIAWAGCPAFFGYFSPEDVSGNWPKWTSGEWKPGEMTEMAISAYGVWVSRRVKEICERGNCPDLNRELDGIVRTFNL